MFFFDFWDIIKIVTLKSLSEKGIKSVRRVQGPFGQHEDNNICIIGVPEGEEKEQEIGNLSEKIVKEKFPNLVKETDMQIQEDRELQL